MLRRNPRVEQLPSVGLHQVEKNFLWEVFFTVSRSAGGEKKQRISLVDFVRFLGFVKQRIGVGELRSEALPDFFSYLVAAVVNAWADGGINVPWLSFKAAAHFADAFFDDALHRSPPSSMKYADCALLCIHHNDWDTVGGLHRQHQGGRAGDETVSGEMFRRNAGDAVDQVGMNLPKRDQRPGYALCKAFDEGISSAFDCQPGGVFRESKITGDARAEPVHEPGEFSQGCTLQDGA